MARLEKQRGQRTVGTYVRVNRVNHVGTHVPPGTWLSMWPWAMRAYIEISLSLSNQRKLEACTEGRPQELVATSPCVSWAPADGPGGSSPLPPASPELRDCLLVMGQEKPMIW